MTPEQDQTVAPEQSLEEKRRAKELDDKLAHGAARTRASVEERRARGEPATVDEIIRTRGLAHTRLPRVPEPMIDDRFEVPTPDATAHRERLRKALVPARFADVHLDRYVPRTPSQNTALEVTRRWLEKALAGEAAMLALVGDTGTGKSHLLYAALNAIIDARQPNTREAYQRPPYARPWYKLANELRYGGEHYLTRRAIEAHEARADLQRARIALVDEVRVTASTAFDDTELAQWACWAYDSLACVMITTNHSPLSDIFGPAGASRFTQVEIVGPDHRQER